MTERQTLFHPPPGRPGWACEPKEQLALLYLAWGWRRYGKTPQTVTKREGWLYFTVRRGRPSLVFPDLPEKILLLAPSDLIILHPDCACGWEDLSRSTAEVCTWVWRAPSQWNFLNPPRGKFLRLKLDPQNRRDIHQLHEKTRREIQRSDESTRLGLECLRLQVDLALVRGQTVRPQPASDAQRIELAARWIEQHSEEHNPLDGLCDYLQLSATTLNRLFQRQWKMNIRSYAKQRRLSRARQLISDGHSVKEAAYLLGYRFANDLSRALHSNDRRVG